jgi:hypothetical protein
MPAPESEPDFAETRVRTVSLPTTAAAPWLARQLLGQWCSEWEVAGSVVDEAVVVVSELVTDCVATGAPVAALRASLGPDALELAVSGAAAGLPSGAADDEAALRRMEIMRGIGSSVEVRPGAQGRTVVVAVPLVRAPWSS